MSILKKLKALFGSKSNKELKKETRIITDKSSGIVPKSEKKVLDVVSSRVLIVSILMDAMKNGRVKSYKNLVHYTEKYPSQYPIPDLDTVAVTLDDELKKLCKTMKLLNYKTTDKGVQAMIRWGEYFLKNNNQDNNSF